jgi:hypothetical protein
LIGFEIVSDEEKFNVSNLIYLALAQAVFCPKPLKRKKHYVSIGRIRNKYRIILSI